MQKFSKDTTNRPHVNSRTILCGTKQQFGRSAQAMLNIVLNQKWGISRKIIIRECIRTKRRMLIISRLALQLILYLYHNVITRFVRFPLWSLEKDRASPKSASFRIPSLSIRRLDPAKPSIKHVAPNYIMLTTNSKERSTILPKKLHKWNLLRRKLHKFKLIITFNVTVQYLIDMAIMKPSQ